MTQLHREGILFAVNPQENPDDPAGPPPNLPFLEILSEFTNKLLKQDKKVVLDYLDKRIGSGMPSRWSFDFLTPVCSILFDDLIFLATEKIGSLLPFIEIHLCMAKVTYPHRSLSDPMPGTFSLNLVKNLIDKYPISILGSAKTTMMTMTTTKSTKRLPNLTLKIILEL